MRRKDSGFENYCGVIAPYKLIWYNNTRSLSLEEDYKNGQVVFYMKKVRINNSITNVLKSTIIILLITCIALLLLCIFFMYIFITYGTSFDDGSKMYLTLILASLIITLILFIVITVQTIIKRNNELKYNYKANNYKHTFRSFGYTMWAIPTLIFTIILSFFILFFVGYLILAGTV